MYLGEIVELGTVEQVFSPPYHPYTEVLLSAITQPDPRSATDRIVPDGEPPSPIDPPSGCRFHTRCPYAMPVCESTIPESIEQEHGHTIGCHLFDEEMIDEETDVTSILADQEAVVTDRTADEQEFPTDSDD